MNMENTKKIVRSIEESISNITMKMITVQADKSVKLLNNKEYRYASLNAVKRAIIPILREFNIKLYQSVCTEDDGLYLVTKLYNDEDVFETHIKIPLTSAVSQNDFHTMGMGVTYYSRRVLVTLFGIIIDEEDDDSTSVVTIKKKILKENTDEYRAVVKSLINNETTMDKLNEVYNIPETVKKSLQIDII